MDDKLQKYLDEAFAPYGDFPAKADVTQELLANLQEKYQDFKKQGMSDEEAYQATIDSVGDVAEIMEQVPHNLTPADEGVAESKGSKTAPKASMLKQADLVDTNLAGKDFSGSAIMEASFDRADVQGTTFKGAALKAASFVEANLKNAVFSGADLQNAKFDKADLTNTKFSGSAFKGAIFAEAKLVNTEFKGSDLSGILFDGMVLDGVIFSSSSLKNTSFKNAQLRNVSFHHSAVKHAIFDGATMDKLTFALLKGAKATLNDVAVV